MRRKYYWPILCTCLILITACDQRRDYSYYVEHPEAIPAEFQRCQSAGITGIHEDPRCLAVIKARLDLQKMLKLALLSGQQFGFHILDEQIRLAALEEKLANYETVLTKLSDVPKNKEEITNRKAKLKTLMKLKNNLKMRIRRRFIVLRLLEVDRKLAKAILIGDEQEG